MLVDCSGDANEEKNPETAFTNKKNALLKLVQESPVRKTIVFCNKVFLSLIRACALINELSILGLSCEQVSYL